MTIADSTAAERVELWRRLNQAAGGVQFLAQDNAPPNDEETQEVDILLNNLIFALNAVDVQSLRAELADPEGAGLVGFDSNLAYPTGTVGEALVDATSQLAAPAGAGLVGFDRSLLYAPQTAGFALKLSLDVQIPIELLGGSTTPGHNNGPAFEAYASMLRGGYHPILLLKGGVYESDDDIVYDRPPKIVGVGGGVFQVGRETDGSYIKDTRPSSANYFFKLTQGAIPGPFTCGVLEDFCILGNHGVTDNLGVHFDDIGWNFATRNLTITNFSKTGLLTYSFNDADHVGLKILACGGMVGGTAYYALDNGPHYVAPPAAGVTTNLQSFYRLHIEHCRFVARINGFAQKFDTPHFEMFADSIISAGHSPLPPIDLGYSGPANAFIGATFVDVGYKTYADLVPDDVAATPALKLAAIPAFIGSTATITGDPVFEGWKFIACEFATNAASKYMDLPGHTVYMSDCIAGRALVYAPGFNLGAGSKVLGNRLHGAVPNVSSDATFGATIGIKAGPILNIPVTGIPTDVSNNTLWWSTGPSNVANVTDITPNAVVGGVHLGSYIGNTIASGYSQTLAEAAGAYIPGGVTVRTGSGASERRQRMTPGNILTNTSSFNVVFDAYPVNGVRMGTDGASIQLTPQVAGVSYLGTPTLPWVNAYLKQIRPGTGTALWDSGPGSPEGVLVAGVGSKWTRTDGGANTTLYIKESGSGNTGWVAK